MIQSGVWGNYHVTNDIKAYKMMLQLIKNVVHLGGLILSWIVIEHNGTSCETWL